MTKIEQLKAAVAIAHDNCVAAVSRANDMALAGKSGPSDKIAGMMTAKYERAIDELIEAQQDEPED